jgi:hypothetical protein
MGNALTRVALACSLLAGCAMYSRKADPLKNPPRIKPDKTALAGQGSDGDKAPDYVDDCTVDFTGVPTTKRQKPAAAKLVASGDATLGPRPLGAANLPPPSTPDAAKATVDAIDRYREALQKDPYDAEATLKLALAYDRVLRKGCALAMLHRLGELADSDKLGSEAQPKIQLVKQNGHWFRGYRLTALKAAGL